MKSSWWGAAFTYIGAVVGAGFASGQEVYQFFGRFGAKGVLGVGVAGLLFGLFGYLALERGRSGNTPGFGALLSSVYPPWMVRVAEGVTAAFLVIGLGVVSSGGGTALLQLTGMPRLIGALATTTAVIAVALSGTRSVIRANSILVPYLVIMILAVAGLSWGRPERVPAGPDGHGWLLSALLYLSYNIFTGIVILLGVGRTMPSRRHSALAAGAGALGLSVLAFAEHHTLSGLTSMGSLPMVDAARRVHAVWGLLFGACLWIALFTTGVAEAYALGQQYRRRVLWLLIGTFLFGLFGFDRLVQVLYPVMGMVAVLLWVPLVYRGSQRGVPGG